MLLVLAATIAPRLGTFAASSCSESESIFEHVLTIYPKLEAKIGGKNPVIKSHSLQVLMFGTS